MISRVTKRHPAPLYQVHVAFLNLFEKAVHWASSRLGSILWSSYLFFTLGMYHPLFFKMLKLLLSPMPHLSHFCCQD